MVNMNIKRRIMSIAILGVLATSISACKGPEASQEKPASTATNVTVHTAEESTIENKLTYTGEIKEGDTNSITSKVNAKVVSINVKEGQYVNNGDVLFVLDSTDLQLIYNQALANYNSAKANYDMVVNATTQQSETSARQNLNAAQIEYDNALAAYNRERDLHENNTSIIAAKNAFKEAQDNLERVQKLFDMGASTRIELETAKNNVENSRANLSSLEATKQSTLEAAKNRYENAEMNLIAAKENLDLIVNVVNSENISTAKAAVDSAKANLDIAKHNLNNTKITAPISGYISSENVNVGQMVTQGMELSTIKNTNTVEGEMSVTESVISDINMGIPATISVKAAGIKNIEGVVSLVNKTKNAATGLYTVRVTIPNEENKLKVGMFADITLITSSVNNTVTVPSESILQEGNELYVYIANGDVAQRVNVVTGISDDKNIQITSGVNAGDKVIVKGKEYLSDEKNQIIIIKEPVKGEA